MVSYTHLFKTKIAKKRIILRGHVTVLRVTGVACLTPGMRGSAKNRVQVFDFVLRYLIVILMMVMIMVIWYY